MIRCHLGRSIIYDTVSELGWRVWITNHGIVPVIDTVLNGTWAPAEKEDREVPEPKYEDECVVSTMAPARIRKVLTSKEGVLQMGV
jgi:putative lipase involved disintegration of autophagic bodies